MDAKDTVGMTATSVAPAKLAPKPKPAGEPELEDPVPSIPLSDVEDSLGSLGAAFSELLVRPPEDKVEEKDLRERRADHDREGEHV